MSSSENGLIKKTGTKKCLLEDTIFATPIPRASSTVDSKFKMKPCYGGRGPTERKKLEEIALQQRRAAVVEIEKKLEYNLGLDSTWSWSEEKDLKVPSSSSSLFATDNTILCGNSTSGICDPSFLKKGTIMEESGFTNLHNVSDLEKEEKKRLENWNYIPTTQVEISFSVDNSKINPPDFMPVGDSLFYELQADSGKDEENNRTKAKHTVEEIAEQLSLLKHDISQTTRDTPTIEELSLAFKSCKNEDPRKIMDQLLKSAEQISILKHDMSQSIRDTPTIEEISLAFKQCKEHDDPRMIMDQLSKYGKNKAKSTVVEAKTEVSEAEKSCSGSSSKNIPVTFEDCLVWGNIEIGDSRLKALHLMHTVEEPDKYKFSIEGNNAFKILVNWPKPSSLSSRAFSCVGKKSCNELLISFQPSIVGQASGYIVIESESNKTSKKVRLNAFGGKSKMLFHGITFDPLSNIHYLILNSALKYTFKLENCGSSRLYFYLSAGFMDGNYEIQPKLGFIKARSHVLVNIKLILKDCLPFESLSSFQGTYLDVGRLMIYFGDESTRLRLDNLISRYRDPEINSMLVNHPFLTCKSFPSSEIDVSLDDPKASFTQLLYDGTNKMEIIIQAERKDLFHGLANLNSKYQLLLKSQELIVKYD